MSKKPWKKSIPLHLTEIANQIILGSILGDGHIKKHHLDVVDPKFILNSQLIIKHSITQEAYNLYKKQLLEQEGLIVHVSYREAKDRIIKNHVAHGKRSIEISTQKNISFNFYRDTWYSDKKYISSTQIWELEALGLAIWYMDDGAKNSSGYYLHTEGFTIEDQILLQEMLLQKFNIHTNIHKIREYKMIYIKKESVNVFNELITPYIHDSMRYKLH